MAQVTVLTAARMLEIEAACIVNGAVVLDRLILTQYDGTQIDAGYVKGEKGDPGNDAAPGSVAPTPDTTPIRTSDSRVKTAPPLEPDDAATKSYIDERITGVELAGGIDLNTITTAGVYTQTTTAEATSGINYPAAIAGVLEVTANNDSSMVWQTYTPYGTNGTVVYKRGRYNGTWSSWSKYSADNNTGFINAFAGVTAPSGWLICDGRALSRTTYKPLFDVIGTAYGTGDGSTTFNIPNLKGRIPVGQDSAQTEFDTRGESGGAKTHTHFHANPVGLSSGNIYIIDPSATAMDLYGSQYNFELIGNPVPIAPVSGKTSGAVEIHGVTSSPSSSLQPYLTMNYIIKY